MPVSSQDAGTPGDAAGFELYDLRVEVVGPPDRPIYCGARPGDHFELHGEMLKLPAGQGFSIYSLAALLPLLPAKQRLTDLRLTGCPPMRRSPAPIRTARRGSALPAPGVGSSAAPR